VDKLIEKRKVGVMKMNYLIWGGLILVAGIVVIRYFKQVFLSLGNIIIHVTVGAIMLYITNIFTKLIDLEVPINIFTVLISGFLGIPGMITVYLLKIWLN